MTSLAPFPTLPDNAQLKDVIRTINVIARNRQQDIALFNQLQNQIIPYATGTWTPTITTSGTIGTPAYTTNVGSYTKVGRLIVAQFNIVLSGWTGSPTGNVTITGLPFASANSANDDGNVFIGQYAVSGLAAGAVGLSGFIAPNSSIISLQQGENTASANLTAAQAGTTPTLIGSAAYHV